MKTSIDTAFSPFVRLVHLFRIPDTVRSLAEHQIGDHALHYFASGSGTCISGGEPITVQPGMLFLVRPGEGYEMHFAPGSSVCMYNIRFDLEDQPEFHCAHPCAYNSGDAKKILPFGKEFPSHVRLKNTGDYTDLFFRLLLVWPGKDVQTVMRAKGILLELLGLIAGCRQTLNGVSDEPRRMHLNEILQKYSSRNGLPPTPEMLAAEAGMSRSSFYRYFSRITGKSIHNYFLEQRILNAKIDLLHTTDAIKNIAERHGFTSVHHFTKVFTRTTGISPGTFRREFADRDS